MHLVDGSTYDIVGVYVCLSLPSGVSFMLHHVCYVLESLISVRQLQDSGWHIFLGENSFECIRIHCKGCVSRFFQGSTKDSIEWRKLQEVK